MTLFKTELCFRKARFLGHILRQDETTSLAKQALCGYFTPSKIHPDTNDGALLTQRGDSEDVSVWNDATRWLQESARVMESSLHSVVQDRVLYRKLIHEARLREVIQDWGEARSPENWDLPDIDEYKQRCVQKWGLSKDLDTWRTVAEPILT